MSDGFLVEAASLDGVSMSVEDDQYVATCEEQTDAKIDTSKVHDTAEAAGLRPINTIADFEARHVRVFFRRKGGGE